MDQQTLKDLRSYLENELNSLVQNEKNARNMKDGPLKEGIVNYAMGMVAGFRKAIHLIADEISA